LQHRDVANEIALVGCGQNLFRAIPRLENLDFTTQDYG